MPSPTPNIHPHFEGIAAFIMGKLRQSIFGSIDEVQLEVKGMKQFIRDITEHVVKQNFKDKCALQISYDTFLYQLQQQGLNKNKISRAQQRFNEIPSVLELLQQLSSKLEKYFKTLSLVQTMEGMEFNPELFYLNFNPEELVGEIVSWVDAEYCEIDERVMSCSEKKLRRMDSLARLLGLGSSLSACSSVCIGVSESPRLIVSANIAKNGLQDEVAEFLEIKLTIIKKYSTTIRNLSIPPTPLELEEISHDMVDELFQHGGNSLRHEILLQAAQKLLHAVCIDDEVFEESEKQAFARDAAFVILLPKLAAEGPSMQVTYKTQINTRFQTDFSLPLRPTISVKDIHAEQLLARFLFEELKLAPTMAIAFGISKLCCLTCYESLKAYPGISVRGHHGQLYQGVVDVRTGNTAKESSERRATTFPWPSPKDTPYNRETEGLELHSPSPSLAILSPSLTIPRAQAKGAAAAAATTFPSPTSLECPSLELPTHIKPRPPFLKTMFQAPEFQITVELVDEEDTDRSENRSQTQDDKAERSVFPSFR